MIDIYETKAELEWAIANNGDRPRTQMAMRWALEALEAMPVIAEAEAKTEEVPQ